VFTMKFMEIFKPEVDTCSLFSKDDIIHIRIQYANQLFFCKRNNVDKSIVLNYKMQVCILPLILFSFSVCVSDFYNNFI
jgi:hypothetical protein